MVMFPDARYDKLAGEIAKLRAKLDAALERAVEAEEDTERLQAAWDTEVEAANEARIARDELATMLRRVRHEPWGFIDLRTKIDALLADKADDECEEFGPVVHGCDGCDDPSCRFHPAEGDG